MAKQSVWGAAIDRLYESGDLDPVKYNAFRIIAKTPEDSKRFWEQIEAHPEEYKPKKETSAAEKKSQQEGEIGQRLLDVLSQGLQQQAGGVNQAIGQSPLTPFQFGGAPPQFTPEQMLPQQQRGILDLFRADPGSVTVEGIQENFPRYEKPLSTKEQKDFAQKDEYYGLLKEGKTTAARREARLAKKDEWKEAVARQRLALDDRKFMNYIKRQGIDTAFDTVRLINQTAKSMAPGEEVDDALFAKAIERLRQSDAHFSDVYDRAVRIEEKWYGKRYKLTPVEELPKVDGLGFKRTGEDIKNRLKNKY